MLPMAQRIMNSTPHSVTNVAPAQLVYGVNVDLDRGVLIPWIDDTVNTSNMHQYVADMLHNQVQLLATAEAHQRERDQNVLASCLLALPDDPVDIQVGSYVLMDYPELGSGRHFPSYGLRVSDHSW
jgi:hypothetical protein